METATGKEGEEIGQRGELGLVFAEILGENWKGCTRERRGGCIAPSDSVSSFY